MDLNVNKSTDFLEPSMADGVLVTLPIFISFTQMYLLLPIA